MTSNQQPMSRSKFSLQEELKRRKAAELRSEIELRKIMQATRPAGAKDMPITSAARTTLASDATIARRSTLTEAAITRRSAAGIVTSAKPVRPNGAFPVPEVVDIIGSRRPLTGKQKQMIIAISAALLITLVFMVMALIVGQSSTTKAATERPYPTVSASDTLARLKLVGVPVNDVQTISNTLFSTQDSIEFGVLKGTDKGRFIVLSYPSMQKAGEASFRLSIIDSFKRWKQIVASNILILASPDTAVTLQQEIASHMTQYLVAPYRSFLPTATATVPAQGN